MQFIEGRRWNREELLMLFGIPLGKWSENATEANAVVADTTFLRDTLWPKLLRVTQELTRDIMLPFYGDDLVVQPQDIRPQNRALELQEMAVALNVMTVNEVRNRYFHLDPLVVGDLPGEQLARTQAQPPYEPPVLKTLPETSDRDEVARALKMLGQDVMAVVEQQ